MQSQVVEMRFTVRRHVFSEFYFETKLGWPNVDGRTSRDLPNYDDFGGVRPCGVNVRGVRRVAEGSLPDKFKF